MRIIAFVLSKLKKRVRKPSRHVSVCKPSRPVSVRKPSHRVSNWLQNWCPLIVAPWDWPARDRSQALPPQVDFIAPNLRIIVEHSLKKKSQLARLCTHSEVNEMKGPKPKKCIVVFDLQQCLEIAKQAQVSEEELEDALEGLD